MQRLSPNALGSLYMVVGTIGYVFNDAMVRRVTERGPEVYQVLFLRSIGLAVLFLAVGRVRNQHLRRMHIRGPILRRVGFEMIATALFFAGLVRMEFANAQAILQLVPFLVMLAAAVILGERVSVRAYITILVGFVGVLIVIRPATSGFSAWSLAIVGSAVFQVKRELSTREVDDDTPAMAIAFLTAIGIALIAGGLSIFEGWHALDATAVATLAASICSLSIGYFFTIETVRVGDLSASAPFRYSALVGAVVFGYLFFGEVPDAFMVVGSLVIVATGLYAVRLERESLTS